MSETSVVKPQGRALRIALAVSVALNLAVAGLFAGMALHHGGFGPDRDGVRDLGFGPFTEALSREDRAALRQAFLAKAPDLRQARREMMADQRDLLAALRAEPFDAAKLSEVMAAQQGRMAARLETGQALMRDFLTAMSPEARLAFADRLEERLSHGRGRDGGGDDDGDKDKAAP